MGAKVPHARRYGAVHEVMHQPELFRLRAQTFTRGFFDWHFCDYTSKTLPETCEKAYL
jgi:hypothetical protein